MVSHQEAKRLVNEYLRAEGSSLVAMHASRNRRFGVWLINYRDPDDPDTMLVGGGYVVTDEGGIHSLSSAPGSLDDLMLTLGRLPGAEPAEVFDTDSGALALLADENSTQADELAAWAQSRRPWPGVLDDERAKPYFRGLLQEIDRARAKQEVYPPASDLFAAFHLTPYEQVKVVLLGQDPYPNPGEAMGLAFSVPRGVPKPKSLVNIHAAMEVDDMTPPQHGDLTRWATQGVLLLNTALTVPRNGERQHISAWKPFTDAVIRHVNEREDQSVVFVLWGRDAQKKKRLIDTDRHVVIEAPHPAARGESQTQFRESRTFSKVNHALRDLGIDPINWAIP